MIGLLHVQSDIVSVLHLVKHGSEVDVIRRLEPGSAAITAQVQFDRDRIQPQIFTNGSGSHFLQDGIGALRLLGRALTVVGVGQADDWPNVLGNRVCRSIVIGDGDDAGQLVAPSTVDDDIITGIHLTSRRGEVVDP